jgi:hypothetical protein
MRREIAIFDGPPAGQTGGALLLLPFRFTVGGTDAITAIIETGPGTASSLHEAAVARCISDTREAAAQVAKAQQEGPGRSTVGAGIGLAMTGLTRPELRRPSLVFLASEGDARLCGDTALAADDQTLSELTTRILRRRAAKALGNSRESFGWTLDLVTYYMLYDLQANGKLSKELSAVLVAYTGEAGRHPSSLEEIGLGVTSRADLEQRLEAENLIFLEDSSPSARIRAFEWLRARKAAPPGYDPLAPVKERRAALEKAVEAAAAAAATAPASPANAGNAAGQGAR